MTTVNPTIPKELESFVYGIDFEENGGFEISSIQFTPLELTVQFSTYIGPTTNSDSITYQWELIIRDHAEHDTQLGWSSQFEYYDSHPLLMRYHEPEASLFFNTPSNNQKQLVSDIYQAHKEVCKDFINVEQFLNRKDLVTQCNSSFGLFAHGPITLMKHYMSVLNAHNMSCNILENSGITKYNDEPPHHMLLTLGNSYFIGKDFVFKKIG